jgi:alpha-tubulin suppressor-like RCC1 family protein
VAVIARDTFGNTAPTFTGSVTVAIGANPAAGILSGTLTVPAVNGVATFTNLSLDKAGTGYTLVATSGTLTGPASTAFAITVGAVSATLSTLVAAPTSMAASTGANGATLTVTARDGFGNPVSGMTVTLAATGTANTLIQPVGTTNVSGQTPGSLSSTKAEAKTITATVNGTVTLTQTATVTVTPGVVTQLVFSVQPTSTMTGVAIAPAVLVRAFDAYGNIATGFTGNVTVAIGTNPGGGTLSGTTIAAAAAGQATFSDINLDRAGAGYTLTASAAGLPAAASAPFNVTAPYSIALTTGGYYACGVASGAVAYCWGVDDAGQLGAVAAGNCNSTPCSATPLTVQGGLSFATVSGGYYHTCGVTTSGQAYCWGANNAHGDNTYSQLGIGTATIGNYFSPVPVVGGLRFLMVSTGADFTCGLTPSGAAYCWGKNTYGQLGNGTTASSTTPVAVAGNLAFVSVTAGDPHACGLTAAGVAYCWGYDFDGRLGDGLTTSQSCYGGQANCSLTPIRVAGNIVFAEISASHLTTCGVAASGAGYCWGDNQFGALGAPSTQTCTLVNVPCSTTPTAVQGGISFVSISAGNEHTCGIASGGAGYCWGTNEYGELGNGTTTNSATPSPIQGSPSFKLMAASKLGVFACGVATNGTAYCWGSNSYGQLTQGAQTVLAPQSVPGLSFP